MSWWITCASEENPTYGNLLGRVEHVAQLGALVTDFETKPEKKEG